MPELDPSSPLSVPALVTTDQLAHLLQVHPVTIRSWARGKTVRAYWTGSAWRFLVREVLADLATLHEAHDDCAADPDDLTL